MVAALDSRTEDAGDTVARGLHQTFEPGIELAKDDRIAHAAHDEALIPRKLGAFELDRVAIGFAERAPRDPHRAVGERLVLRLAGVEDARGLYQLIRGGVLVQVVRRNARRVATVFRVRRLDDEAI